MKKQAGTLLLAAVALSSLTGWGFKGIKGEPVPRDSYLASAAAGGQALAARSRVEGTPKVAQELVIAPVQCTFEFTDTAYMGQYNSFQTWWVDKDESADLQSLCNTVYNTLTAKLKENNIYFTGAKSAFDKDELKGVGQYPRGQLGKGRVFSSFKRPEYMRNDTTAILKANPNAQAVLYTQVRAVMRPTSLSTLDDLGMINYPIYAQLDVRVCKTPGDCVILTAPMQDPEVAKLADFTLPIVRATEKDKANFKEINQFSRDLFAQAVTAPVITHWSKLTVPQ